MAAVIIDVNKYQNLVQANKYLTEVVSIGIDPIPDILNDCPLRYAEYTREGTGGYTAICQLRFILAEDAEGNATKELEAELTIEVTGQKKEYTGTLSYPLAEDKSLVFNLLFKSGTTSSILVATCAIEESFPLVNFGGALPGLDGVIPDEIAIGTNYNAQIVMTNSGRSGSTGTNTKKFLLGLGFNSKDNLNIDLSKLPLIGTQFPPDPASNNLTIQLLLATQNLPRKNLNPSTNYW